MRPSTLRHLAPAMLALALALAGPVPAAAQGAPVIVALTFDTSGSIRKSDLEHTRSLALAILAGLPPGSEIAVFSFNDQSQLILPRTAKADDVEKAIAGIATAGRYTALHDAIYDASRYLRDAPPARKAIVLITDGKDENSSLNLEDGLKVAQESQIPVFAVGVGHIEEHVLRRIAKLTEGQYQSMAEATGAGVAAAILQLPAPKVTTPAPPPPAPSTLAVAKPSAASRVDPRLLYGLGILLIVGSVALLAYLRFRPAGVRCPDCGQELADPNAPCRHCGAAASGKEPSRGQEDASETMVMRMPVGDEPADKTMVLRFRPTLTVQTGPAAGAVIDLSPVTAISLGRSKANDVVIEDTAVSSEHCRIRPEAGGFVLNDLNSTNGTYVNERRVTRHTLVEGDLIRLGDTSVQFRMER